MKRLSSLDYSPEADNQLMILNLELSGLQNRFSVLYYIMITVLILLNHRTVLRCCNSQPYFPVILFTKFIDFALEICSDLLWRTIKASSIYEHSAVIHQLTMGLKICFTFILIPSCGLMVKEIFLNGIFCFTALGIGS